MGNRYLTTEQRFDSSYIPVTESGCWLWTGAVSKTGYARFRVNGNHVMAHRYSYERFRSKIPNGKQMDHLCRVRCCVNPFHLEPVTLKENVLRGAGVTAMNARKTSCKRGHQLSGRNLVIKGNTRQCRICQNAKAATFREKVRAADPGYKEKKAQIEAHQREVSARVFEGRSQKTVCKRGHILSQENVRVAIVKNGKQKQRRLCRACDRWRARQYRLEANGTRKDKDNDGGCN